MGTTESYHIQIIVRLKPGVPNPYGNAVCEQTFAVPLPRSADDIGKMVTEQVVAMVKTWADATMSDARLLAETTAGTAKILTAKATKPVAS